MSETKLDKGTEPMKSFLLDANEAMRREMARPISDDILSAMPESDLRHKLRECEGGIDAYTRWAALLREEIIRRHP